MREFSEKERVFNMLNIERPKEKVATIHGVFRIEEYDRKRGCNTLMCTDCWYKNRKVTGAPCIEGEWCGDLNSYLVPIRLVKDIPERKPIKAVLSQHDYLCKVREEKKRILS